MNFKGIYVRVAGIVHRTRKDYYIQLWEKSDWDQEGMIVLVNLLKQCPGIENDESRLYRYFKVKFRNHVLDILRKQESYKRRINRQNYEEIGSIGHRLYVKDMAMSDKVILRDMLSTYRSRLSPQEQINYDRLIGGEQFQGRKRMLTDLQDYLKDFGES